MSIPKYVTGGKIPPARRISLCRYGSAADSADSADSAADSAAGCSGSADSAADCSDCYG